MESIKKLQKKYGKKKLNQFFKDIHKFLTVPQKKLNKKYIRLTHFGSDTSSGSSPKKQKRQGEFTPKPDASSLILGGEQAGQSPAPAPAPAPPSSPESPPPAPQTFLAPASSPESAPPSSPESPPPVQRTFLAPASSGAPPASIELGFVVAGYGAFKQKASNAIIVAINNRDNMSNFGQICLDYSDILQLFGGTKYLAEQLPGPFLNPIDYNDGDEEESSETLFGTTQYNHLTEQRLKELSEKNSVEPKDADDLKRHYNYESTSGKAKKQGWDNTMSQNSLPISDDENKKKCRCALCGCFMFYADASTNGDNRFLCHVATVQLEHQIAGSTALRMYVDLYKYSAGDDNTNWAKVPDRLKEIEETFFENIGGSKAKRENRFVYCCSLCNQIKSDMYPFETDTNTLRVSKKNLDYFEDALGLMFRRIIGSSETKNDFKKDWNIAGLNNANVCAFVWVLQTIFTFLNDNIQIDELRNLIPGKFTLELVRVQVKSAAELLSGKGQQPTAIWDYIKQKKIQQQVCYFGRPVYSAGDTGGEVGETKTLAQPFGSLLDKYSSIIEDIKTDFAYVFLKYQGL